MSARSASPPLQRSPRSATQYRQLLSHAGSTPALAPRRPSVAEVLSPSAAPEGSNQKWDVLKKRLAAGKESARCLLKEAQEGLCLADGEDFAAFAWQACLQDPKAWRVASVLAGRLKRPKDAASILMKVHCAEPMNAEVCCCLARVIPDQASYWRELALKANPQSSKALESHADGLRAAGCHEEAAAFYQQAVCHSQRQVSARLSFRLGESLILLGRNSEGRDHLCRVLQHGSGILQAHALLWMAKSYLQSGDSNHKAVGSCKEAEDMLARFPGTENQLKQALALRGLAQLRAELADEAVHSLTAAGNFSCGTAQRTRTPLDDAVTANLIRAKVLLEDLPGAQQILSTAGNLQSSELLAAAAYFELAKGELVAAQALLNRAMVTDKDSPVLLLWAGYLLLRHGQLDTAIQYLQKCLRQPAGTLAFSSADRGKALLYLAVAWHCRKAEPDSKASSCMLVECKEWVKQGLQLQPALHQALISRRCHGGLSGQAFSGNLPRLGGVDLVEAHAQILALYAFAKGAEVAPALPPLPRTAVFSPRARIGGLGSLPMLGVGLSSSQASCANQAVGPLLGTVSTGLPASSSPSRQASEPSLSAVATPAQALAFGDASFGVDIADLAATLPTDKVLNLADIELGEVISRGEFAIVRHAVIMPCKQDVVVKLLHVKDCPQEDEAAAKELISEIAIMAELSHPRLVPFVGAIFQSLGIALVTDLAAGGNLYQAIHVSQRQFRRSERFELSGDLFEGVRYLHFRQPAIVHLDLKSMNLLLNSEGRQLQICDFGLARVVGACGFPTQLPADGGSPRHMPPECHDRTIGPVTVKADIWSAGCVLFEIFGECLPFAECSKVQQIIKALLVEKRGPKVPENVEESVRKLLDSVLSMEASTRPAAASVLEYLQELSKEPRPDPSRYQWCP